MRPGLKKPQTETLSAAGILSNQRYHNKTGYFCLLFVMYSPMIDGWYHTWPIKLQTMPHLCNCAERRLMQSFMVIPPVMISIIQKEH